MTRSEKWLVWLLRGGGVLLLSAIVPAMMPFEWMVETHSWLGLGELPDRPIVGYLARSISALYAMHGVLVLYMALDVRRYLGLVRCMGVLCLLFGAGVLVIDIAVGLPRYWVIGEGPFVIALGVAVLVLASGVKRD